MKAKIKHLKLGAIASDGGMGTSLTQIYATEKGSVSLKETDAQTKKFEINESDYPYDMITTELATIEVEGNTYEITPANLQLLKGGTLAGGSGSPQTWKPGASVELEVSAEIETVSGFKISIPRMKLIGKMDFTFSNEELLKLSFKLEMLQPKKAGEAPYTITFPNAG